MSEHDFFDEQAMQSRVKAEIVSKYFWAWAKVIIGFQKKNPKFDQKIAYIDLFAGPGRYKNGKASTPIMVIEKAVNDYDLCERLVTILNDRDADCVENLKAEISNISGIEKLKFQPIIKNNVVGEQIAEIYEKKNLIPTLSFVDPWGYKGLSLKLVNSFLKDFGCDCIFFFNYNRINMGLRNPKVIEHINALFGEERADRLRERMEAMEPQDREAEIVNELAIALQELGGKFVLPFCFKDENGRKTSHHLIFVSKHIRGYNIMKRIMADYSSGNDQGVPSFHYSPPASFKQLFLFEFSRPLDDLSDMLMHEYAGMTLRTGDLINEHNVGRPFIEPNYKDVLRELEETERIVAVPTAKERRMSRGKRSFGDNVMVTFPPKESK